MRILALGDIHGAHRALKQVLERAAFNNEEDMLISLGDVADGWPETPECVEELLKVKNGVMIQGNHDWWTKKFLKKRKIPDQWFEQGGKATLKAYLRAEKIFDPRHLDFFERQVAYFIGPGNRLFLHGGYNPQHLIEDQKAKSFCWDKTMWQRTIELSAAGLELTNANGFAEIFIGHCNTLNAFPDLKPVNKCNVWNLDQGVRAGGKLTLMDVETKAYWQSDPVRELYADWK